MSPTAESLSVEEQRSSSPKYCANLPAKRGKDLQLRSFSTTSLQDSPIFSDSGYSDIVGIFAKIALLCRLARGRQASAIKIMSVTYNIDHQLPIGLHHHLHHGHEPTPASPSHPHHQQPTISSVKSCPHSIWPHSWSCRWLPAMPSPPAAGLGCSDLPSVVCRRRQIMMTLMGGER